MKLRPYQIEAVDSIFEYFQNHGGTDHVTGLPIRANPIVAMQTGLGKSIVIAEFIRRSLQYYPDTRGLMAVHVHELISQNYNKIKEIWPQCPIGIYSASLGKKDSFQPIIYGGVRSVVGKYPMFGYRDYLIIDECFHPDVEILTETGFVAFKDLKDQKVAQYNSYTKNISFVNPINYIKKEANEGLISVETDKTFSILATPNHEMLVRTTWNDVTAKKKLKDVVKGGSYKIPVSGYAIGNDNVLLPWEKFAICYQADGNLHKTNKDGTSITAFSFSKQRKIDVFLELMKDGNFDFREISADNRNLSGNVKAKRRFMVYLRGTPDKTIDHYFNISNLSLNKAKDIIEYMNIWDGHVATKNTYLYTTTNKKMADFYQAVATLAGHKTNLKKVEDNRSDTFSDCYRLFINLNKQEVDTQNFEQNKVEYSGFVYCVEVPDGNIITRYNGKVVVTGNCHLVSPDAETSYIKLISELMYGEYVKPGQQPTKEQFQKALDNPNCNPYLKVIGFSASPFRSGLGMLTNGPIFTDFCYNSCDMQGWARMLAQGYLAPLHPKPTRTTLDVSGIKVQNGEFNQAELQAKIDKKDINQRCLLELLEHSVGKKCGLIFASGIDHAEHLADLMNNLFNEECVLVHSGNKDYPRTKAQNEQALKLWKAGKVKWAVNVNALTTGVDKPELDIIGMLRPTLSSALWIQMLGRGTRPAPDKAACVVLDFAGNTPRNGPVNDPRIPRMKGTAEGEMPVKICQACGTYNHARATECLACGQPFPINTKLVSTASSQALMRGEMPIVETFNVIRAVYSPHVSKAQNRSMIKVAYHCDKLKTFFEYITLESKVPGGKMDYATKKGRDWFRQRAPMEPPLLNETVMLMSKDLRQPARLNVWINRTNGPEILGVEF
jgi:DNA repair protein RadD